jgi:hypothetical protein
LPDWIKQNLYRDNAAKSQAWIGVSVYVMASFMRKELSKGTRLGLGRRLGRPNGPSQLMVS